MGKSDYLDLTETQNWNVADSFSKIKLMKHLAEVDEYETLAKYGSNSLGEDFLKDEQSSLYARVLAIDWLNHSLLMIIKNSMFAVKNKDKEILKKFKEDLLEIKSHIPHSYIKEYNQRTKKSFIIINEDIFQKLLTMMISIDEQLYTPLNSANLIYSSTEEFDPDEIKAKLMKKMVDSR